MDKPQEIEFANLLFGGIAVMVILSLSIVVFVVLYQRKLYLQQARLHQIELNHQRTVLEAVLNSQESERERIAQDLHDEVGASLSTAKLFVNQIKYESSPEEMKSLAGQSSQILGDIVGDIRQIAYNLSPLALKNLGLEGAIKTLLNRLEASGISIYFLCDVAHESVSIQQQLTLYRIVQEALGNALKHAEATQISVQLRQQQQLVQLYIEDNGKGFNYQDIQSKHDGLGMDSIKARAKALDAELTINSRDGQGTSLNLFFRCTQQ
jgi:signal transduction histidine kinase